MIDSRVYYGEYTLKHWIDLMLSENIKLPPYQRHFVWQKSDISRLIKSLKEKQFVQPVTIAMYNAEKEKYNIILDGQQRLTSVLLAYLGYIPNRQAFLYEHMAEEDDSNNDDLLTNEIGPILWDYTCLLGSDNHKEAIVERLSRDSRYIDISGESFMPLGNDFWENTYIGFSYIIPESDNHSEIQGLFTRLFRNINYLGKKLDALESRRSLYFQEESLTNYFEGITKEGDDVLCGLKIMENLQPCGIDFLRYLSILSQYFSNDENTSKVLVGYSAYSSREGYYADYVSYILDQGAEEQEMRSNKFDSFKFDEVFPNNCWQQRYKNLKQAVEKLKEYMPLKNNYTFTTWMESDFWLFGLIYHIVFKGKVLNDSLTYNYNWKGRLATITLQKKIENTINKMKTNEYLKNTNRLGNLRERIKLSCDIYSNYVH